MKVAMSGVKLYHCEYGGDEDDSNGSFASLKVASPVHWLSGTPSIFPNVTVAPKAISSGRPSFEKLQFAKRQN
jgi:hypothetical protein